jgi:hypothetical protein
MEAGQGSQGFITKKIWEVVEGDQPNSLQEGHQFVIARSIYIININRVIAV